MAAWEGRMKLQLVSWGEGGEGGHQLDHHPPPHPSNQSWHFGRKPPNFGIFLQLLRFFLPCHQNWRSPHEPCWKMTFPTAQSVHPICQKSLSMTFAIPKVSVHGNWNCLSAPGKFLLLATQSERPGAFGTHPPGFLSAF